VLPDDTDARARAVQFEILRAMPDERRAAMAIAMSEETTRWSRAALRELMPGASEGEVVLRWIEVVYGRELAERVRPLRDRLGRG
jgi:hypothetical protein